ncbi:MAG: Adenosine kinase [Candidatus Magasanikbacteria bacterium GW2011_GWC2_37_14]|uniref:Adenosine kinase n=1 Tax=Candidatus Magasanikbacteria bacterium GW2011_GWC2_37_14 TaxID=1619046 RepID=A0A0G0GNR7_9BACT|nr:MAG: Adenosine kinase [Candidatus Magasanikbacteria bacterium GW2011_GWC2_37_14]
MNPGFLVKNNKNCYIIRVFNFNFMAILVSGSLAYDYIMDFPDSFKNHILPNQLHILNVCFVVDNLQRNFGGTAGNIAYTMNLLSAEPLIFAPLGEDGKDYLNYFKKLNLKTDYIFLSQEKLTASAHITTDKDNNQITAFYNGALIEGEKIAVKDLKDDVAFALISPTQKEVMIKHAKECYELQIPFCFDPGQQVTAFSAQELMMVIGQAKFLIGNDYELKLIEEKTGWGVFELLKHVEVVIITLGEKGSLIVNKDGAIEVGVCPAISVDDPTGAGDAYRAGFFSAFVKGKDLKTCGQVGAVAATYAVENYGTQNHCFTLAEFKNRYEKAFVENLTW